MSLMIQSTWYHKLLRTAMVLCALILLFDSGILSPVTKQLSLHAQQYIATGVGMSAQITPTETNTLTAELTAKEAELEAREEALRQRELDTGIRQTAAGSTSASTYYLTIGLILLLILVIFNYVFDYIRSLNVARVRYE